MIKGSLNKFEVGFTRLRFKHKRNSESINIYNGYNITEEKFNHVALLGFLGELAFAKTNDIYPTSLFVEDDVAMKNKYDFHQGNHTIEIKTVDAFVPSCKHLIVQPKKEKSDLQEKHKKINEGTYNEYASFYVLMAVGLDKDNATATYEIRGYVEGFKLFRNPVYDTTSKEYKGKLKYLKGNPRVIHQEELSDYPQSFLQEIKAL